MSKFRFIIVNTLFLSLFTTISLHLTDPDHHEGHTHPGDYFGVSEAHADNHQYTCGMHPFILQDEPGTCPICAMDLTPVRSETTGDGDSGASTITIDPVTRQNMGVRTAPVSRRNIHRTIRTVGVVGYVEPLQYSVNTKIDGWIENLHVNETGAIVKKGQPLLDIYSPELVAAQEDFLLALRNKTALQNSGIPEISAGAGRLLESSRKRLQYLDISDEQIEKLSQTGTALKTLVLHAQYDGIITVKKAFSGMYAKAGMELFQISDISSVWVYADIYEYEIPWVKIGQNTSIQLPYNREPITGTISTIYPYVDPKTRTVKVRIDLQNPDLELKPDMYVNVRMATETVNDILTVPVEAVLNSGEKKTVFIDLGEGKFTPREIELGLQSEDGFVEVKHGIEIDEKVVISAQFMLDSESTLREAIQKMLQPKDNNKPEGEAEDSLDDLFGQDNKEDLEDLFN
ncbi:MAG: efflux RND transporter periplasmic adaptor subunit [Desulfobulbaceae bacterium]|uniref:Efflux RND transporter periplasmic adaptor subunit n=1 Tax=Candidatus Desulfobia pelagia TaxID=2841692 RepID=A0A8J6TBM0_9BACT|nr:efflux RND transporter periplasmic adaptor subunit [Candidatus Desulfobia pelagia]